MRHCLSLIPVSELPVVNLKQMSALWPTVLLCQLPTEDRIKADHSRKVSCWRWTPSERGALVPAVHYWYSSDGPRWPVVGVLSVKLCPLGILSAWLCAGSTFSVRLCAEGTLCVRLCAVWAHSLSDFVQMAHSLHFLQRANSLTDIVQRAHSVPDLLWGQTLCLTFCRGLHDSLPDFLQRAQFLHPTMFKWHTLCLYLSCCTAEYSCTLSKIVEYRMQKCFDNLHIAM